jgi:hypothetical protein
MTRTLKVRPAAMGHKFNPKLLCVGCGISWAQHQKRRRKCTVVNGKCGRGHTMTPENTYVRGSGEAGKEACITCMSIDAKIAASRKAAKAARVVRG